MISITDHLPILLIAIPILASMLMVFLKGSPVLQKNLNVFIYLSCLKK